MTRVDLFGWLSLLFVACAASTAGAEPRPLKNDLSRKQLFTLWLNDQAAAAPGKPGPETVLPLPFTFPDHTRDDSIFGIDVSHHNEDDCRCRLDWKQITPRKIAFAYLKASQGRSYFDPRFRENWAAAAREKLHRGAYHFLTADEEPGVQANNFVRILAGAGRPTALDLPPSLDIEWDYRRRNGAWVLDPNGNRLDFWSKLAPAEILNRMKVWLQKVEQASGKVPLIYTNRAWWRQVIGDESAIEQFARYPIWIADYSEQGRGAEIPGVPNNRNWTLWQFTESGRLGPVGRPGNKNISGTDVSIFKGSKSELLKALGMN